MCWRAQPQPGNNPKSQEFLLYQDVLQFILYHRMASSGCEETLVVDGFVSGHDFSRAVATTYDVGFIAAEDRG